MADTAAGKQRDVAMHVLWEPGTLVDQKACSHAQSAGKSAGGHWKFRWGLKYLSRQCVY